MTDPLHSQNLVPFKKRRGPYHIPGMTGENEERTLEVDNGLDPEEARFIRHYLGYADTLLKMDAVLESKEAPSGQNISLVEASGQDQIEDQPAGDQDDQLDRENPTHKAA